MRTRDTIHGFDEFRRRKEIVGLLLDKPKNDQGNKTDKEMCFDTVFAREKDRSCF